MWELIRIEEGEEELVLTGTRARMESEKDYSLSDYEPGGECEGEPIPEYRVQLAA